MTHKFYIYLCSFLLITTITGCSTVSGRPKNMQVAFPKTGSLRTHLFEKIALARIKGGRDTKHDTTLFISDADFKNALKKSLKNYDMLNTDGNPEYYLSADLQILTTKYSKNDTMIEAEIYYKLKNKYTDSTIWADYIISNSKTSEADAFFYYSRKQLALEKAIQKNFNTLLTKFTSKDDKAMFKDL